MSAIYKQVVLMRHDIFDTPITVSFPLGAKIISAQNQQEELSIWAVIPTPIPLDGTLIDLLLVLTGPQHVEGIDLSHWRFLNIVQFEEGQIIVHVFTRL